jgi:hypothetical protein
VVEGAPVDEAAAQLDAQEPVSYGPEEQVEQESE